ncbi:MAG: molybdopterin-guanine dinucleotide biosynthesis protein B [Candidatus Thorarchaeota archaeon]
MIGYSGSGKTHFILNAIKLLKKNLNYEVAIVKNIHEHQIDKEDKDSFKYGEAGAQFSITKNVKNETTIFLRKEISIKELLEWITSGPYKIDLIFIEGFRNLNYPTVLCLKNFEEIKPQLTKNVRMISGLICSQNARKNKKIDKNLPIIDIQKEFEKFLKIFNIK